MSKQIATIEAATRWKEKLLANDKYYFKTLMPSMLAEDTAVVYVIFDKSTDEALYVGRTRKLRRRLYTNHLQGNKSTARLKKYIVEDNQNFPEVNDYNKAKHGLRITAISNMSKCKIHVNEGMWKGFSDFYLTQDIWRKNIDTYGSPSSHH